VNLPLNAGVVAGKASKRIHVGADLFVDESDVLPHYIVEPFLPGWSHPFAPDVPNVMPLSRN
jgi:hypothetical protein